MTASLYLPSTETLVTLAPLVQPAPGAPIPYLAAGHYLGKIADGRHAVVAIGGHDAKPCNNGVQAVPRVELLLVDGAGSQIEVVSLSTGDPADLAMFARTAAEIVALPGGDLVLVGGFTSFREHLDGPEACEGQSNECFPHQLLRFKIDAEAQTLQIVDSSVSMTLGPLGATATLLVDG